MYEGSCDELVCVAGNDDSCGFQSEVSWIAEHDVEYFVYVHGFDATGEFRLSVDYAATQLPTEEPVPAPHPTDTPTPPEVPDPPSNDLCTNAHTYRNSISVFGRTDSATEDDVELCEGNRKSDLRGVWF